MELPTLDLFYILARSGVKGLPIPETYVFRDGACQGRFFYSSSTRLVSFDAAVTDDEIRKRTQQQNGGEGSIMSDEDDAETEDYSKQTVHGKREALRRYAVYDRLADRASLNEIVAVLILPVPTGRSRLALDYLTAGRLRHFLESELEYECLVSAFIHPSQTSGPGGVGRYSLAQCVYTTNTLFLAEQYTNRHSCFSTDVTVAEKTTTSATSQSVKLTKLSQGTETRLRKHAALVAHAFERCGFSSFVSTQDRVSLFFAISPPVPVRGGDDGEGNNSSNKSSGNPTADTTEIGRWVLAFASEVPELPFEMRSHLDSLLQSMQPVVSSDVPDEEPGAVEGDEVESLDWGEGREKPNRDSYSQEPSKQNNYDQDLRRATSFSHEAPTQEHDQLAAQPVVLPGRYTTTDRIRTPQLGKDLPPMKTPTSFYRRKNTTPASSQSTGNGRSGPPIGREYLASRGNLWSRDSRSTAVERVPTRAAKKRITDWNTSSIIDNDCSRPRVRTGTATGASSANPATSSVALYYSQGRVGNSSSSFADNQGASHYNNIHGAEEDFLATLEPPETRHHEREEVESGGGSRGALVVKDDQQLKPQLKDAGIQGYVTLPSFLSNVEDEKASLHVPDRSSPSRLNSPSVAHQLSPLPLNSDRQRNSPSRSDGSRGNSPVSSRSKTSVTSPPTKKKGLHSTKLMKKYLRITETQSRDSAIRPPDDDRTTEKSLSRTYKVGRRSLMDRIFEARDLTQKRKKHEEELFLENQCTIRSNASAASSQQPRSPGLGWRFNSRSFADNQPRAPTSEEEEGDMFSRKNVGDDKDSNKKGSGAMQEDKKSPRSEFRSLFNPEELLGGFLDGCYTAHDEDFLQADGRLGEADEEEDRPVFIALPLQQARELREWLLKNSITCDLVDQVERDSGGRVGVVVTLPRRQSALALTKRNLRKDKDRLILLVQSLTENQIGELVREHKEEVNNNNNNDSSSRRTLTMYERLESLFRN